MIYLLATGNDEVTRTILDDVVTVLIPSANPDGQVLVTDWYRKNVGTDYERARMPWLYHHYAGHDNNRDFFQANLVETQYWNGCDVPQDVSPALSRSAPDGE